MGFETRRHGEYFYRKRRVGDKVLSEYVGNDYLAYATAAHDKQVRAVAGAERDRHKAQAKQAAARDRQIVEFGCRVKGVVAAHLTAHGYHLHRRQWRKRRDSMTELTKLPTVAADEISVLSGTAHRLQLSVLEVNARTVDVILGDVERVRADLGWQTSPAAERLLIEHIGLCWLQLQLLQQHYAKNTGNNYTQRVAEHFEKRLNMAHHRFLTAVETLAKVRRLTVNLQINVAHQQVIAG